MVHYMSQRQPVEPPGADSPSADIHKELAALQIIGKAFADLPNDAARVRVLRWATERFAPALTPPRLAPVTAPAARDPLTTEDLSDLFDEPGDRSPDPEPDSEPESAAPRHEPLESMVRGFVSDFQRIAKEWDGE
jgi:hypothetical protein